MNTTSRLAALALACAFVSPALAQVEPDRGTPHLVDVDSGYVSNDSTSPAMRGISQTVWSQVLQVPGASSLRLTYAGVLLAGAREPGLDGSFLRITSMRDGASQTQFLIHVEQWKETSAYFNGDSVLLELVARPGTGENRIIVNQIIAGPETGEDTICGTTDDRVLSFDNRVARNQPTGCTSWMISDCNHCFLTAGHCAGSGLQIIQFNVPLSTSGGSIQHPPPQDQYAVDTASLQSNGGQGTGNDWAYFGVHPNSNTNLTPWQAYGGQAFDLQATPPPVSGQNIRITGNGSTSSPVSPTWYLVQKTHAGPYASFAGTTVRYSTDTTGGNSGSPVIVDGTNQAIGIHTHGGCNASGGSNIGTGSNHAGLQSALANPAGVCDCPAIEFTFPNGLPQIVAPDGSTTIRVQIGGQVPHLAGSVRFHVSTGGAYQTLVPASVGGNQFDATVPSSSCLTNVQFYFSAQDQSSTTYTSPQNAPTSVYSATSADGTVTVRNYNMNTTPAGWGVTNTNLATGAWVRGTPIDSRGPAADFDGSGQCWVTGNVNNEDVDGGPTILTTETFDLSGNNDPYVSYALWFETTGADTMLVQASQNGGGSWITLETLSANQGWVVSGFRVLSHFTNLNQIRVRWSIADQPNNSVTEGAVDTFKIDDFSCTQAAWASYGAGCVGGAGTPSLALLSLPALGTTFSLDVGNLSGGAAFMVTGFGQQNVSLTPFGFGAGCNLLVTTDAVQLLSQAGGMASWSIPIPNDPSLANLHIFNQIAEVGTVSAVSAGGDGTVN